ncbi:hypothetical protein CkaCkLH20_01349 [Colletotrichum karsti]|uniref:LPXTG-domain-containing protein n=1 Tax=Colletotrichum karsti TaxID=1095194 RepID=A0A9P6IEY5_9PEZI|nr:uncharacterized protein CkaCkLH20_01349 [Colletotrichum karsti]KAF9881199.1 hypothetical protein CkaCkLH20_01349 [Colletotrichum karsti]
MTALSLWHFLAGFWLITIALSLEVTPGSDCAALCLGGTNETTVDTATTGTNSSDIVCEDAQYHTTGKGIKFKNCVSCLQKSEAAKGAASDAAWFLYNIRYAVDVCLFDFPDAISHINSPCIINSACRPLKNALTAGLTTPDAATSFDYCTADGDKFSSSNWWSCVRCLQSSEDQSYLSNFLIALKAGCQQKPANGHLIGLTGQLFSDSAVNITEPTTNTTLPGDGGASSTTMTTGTIVGIAVGGGLVFVGAICLFIIYCRRQRKQKLLQGGDSDTLPHQPRSHSNSFVTMNNSPYVPIGDHKKSSSINSYNYELQEKQSFSNNADYYDKIEQDIQAGREMAHYNFDPRSNNHALGSALPTHPAYIPRAMSRQSTRVPEPQPPSSRKTNTPDSYALQTYLNAVNDEGVTGIKAPPAAAVSRTPSPAHSHESRGSQAVQPKMVSVPPPPPPPGPPTRKTSSRIPSLVLPSVPRIRVPKKYSPPQIKVQGATPIADQGETENMQISQPLTFHQERFADRPLAGRAAVISHVAPAREDPQEYEGDMPIRSGKSTLYG